MTRRWIEEHKIERDVVLPASGIIIFNLERNDTLKKKKLRLGNPMA